MTLTGEATGWQPVFPLVLAERHIDFPAHETHIYERRNTCDRVCRPLLRRLAFSLVAHHGLAPAPIVAQLATRLTISLDATAAFGYRQTRREVRSLRSSSTVTGRYAVPDAGQYGTVARGGLDAIRRHLLQRGRETAAAVADAAATAYRSAAAVPQPTVVAAVAAAAARALHNHVLELVGETLTLGRTAGALSLPQPPEFAMRSEQLDKRMCGPCGEFHGEIAQVDTPDYYDLSPPNGCLGGGRCRGIWVYGDTPDQVEQAA